MKGEQAVFLVVQHQQGTGVPLRECAVGDGGLDLFGKAQQAQGVCHAHPAAAHALRDAFLRHAELALQLIVRGGLFEGVEICALDVFDEREF